MYEGKSTPLRLIGVATPEITASDEPVQCFGPEAKEYLEVLLTGKKFISKKIFLTLINMGGYLDMFLLM